MVAEHRGLRVAGSSLFGRVGERTNLSAVEKLESFIGILEFHDLSCVEVRGFVLVVLLGYA